MKVLCVVLFVAWKDHENFGTFRDNPQQSVRNYFKLVTVLEM